MSESHLAFEEWGEDWALQHQTPRPGPHAEPENPERCIICGAPFVTCKGEDHHGNEQSTGADASLQHYAEVFREADREASERIAGIREGINRDLNPDDEYFIEFG